MAYYSNLEKIVEEKPNKNKQKKFNPKTCAIILTVVATIGYFSLFTNLVGFMKHFLLGVFGIFAYAIFTTLYVISGLLLKGKKYHITKKYFLATIFALLSVLIIFHMAFSAGVDFSSFGAYLSNIYEMQVSVGGLLLGLIVYPFQKFLNFGAYVVFAIVLVVCITIIYNTIAEANSLSKINFKLFGKKNKQNNDYQNSQTKSVENTRQSVENARVYKNEATITDIKNGSTNEFVGQNSVSNFSESVGLNAEIKREKTAREIAREKLGLDRTDERSVHLDSSANQLDTFKKNYMNGGGSVFETKNYVRPDFSNSNLNGTFGYSTVFEKEREKSQRQVDVQKQNEYRKFMGIPLSNDEETDVFQPSFISNYDDYTKHDSTLSNDEKLFGSPKESAYNQSNDYEQFEAEQNSYNNSFDEKENFDEMNNFDNFDKTESINNNFMDKLVSDTQNEEIPPQNVDKVEVQEENDLFNI